MGRQFIRLLHVHCTEQFVYEILKCYISKWVTGCVTYCDPICVTILIIVAVSYPTRDLQGRLSLYSRQSQSTQSSQVVT